MRIFLLLPFILLINNTAYSAQVFFTDTISVRNTAPISMLFSLPQPDYFVDREHKVTSFRTDFELTNYISSGYRNNETLLIDGETWRIRNKLSYQFDKQLQIQISTAWIKHSGGVSDRFIYHFHDVLGLPQNGRSDEFHDQLFWQLSSNEKVILLLDEEKSSWGDTEVALSWKPNLRSSTQINVKLKLPTGNFSKQTGSNRPDLNLSVSQQNPDWLRNRPILREASLALWYGAGLGYLSDIDQLEELSQNPISLSLRGGFAWQALPSWQLKAQIDTHSPLFDSELRELGWLPLQISFESVFQISQDISLYTMISEDLRPRSVPDVILSTGLEVAF